MLGRLLAAHVVDDPEAPPNYSVRFAEPDAGARTRDLHLLYYAHSPVIRSRGATRLLHGLAAALSVHDEVTWPGDALGLTALALVRDGEAVVVPAHYRHFTEDLEPRLARHGIQVGLATALVLEPGTGRLVIPEPRVRLDEAASAELEARYPTPASERLPAAPGGYVLRAWGTARLPANTELSLATGISKTIDQVTRPTAMSVQQAADTVRAAFETARPFGVPGRPADVAARVVELFG